MLIDTWQKATINFRINAYCRKFLKESRLPAEEVRKIQFTRMKKLLCDVYQTHPFYQERFDASQFNPFNMTELNDIKKVPILQKEEYRQLINSLLEKGEKRYKNWYNDKTGGSTGIPLRVLRNWDERAYMLGKWMRVLYLNGYTWRDHCYTLSNPAMIRRDSVLQRFGLYRRCTIPYTDPVETMVERYLKVKPQIVFGNKTHIVQLALYCNQHNIKLPKPDLCISFAETMDGPSRGVIEQCFGEDILMESYGAIECSTLAYQMKGENYFRFSHSTNYLEVLDEDGQDTDLGGSVVTDLFIRSFPMIRYNFGDILDTEDKDGLPIIKKIIGRQDDTIIFADGKRVPWHIFAIILERQTTLKQFRVIQEEYDKIRIQLAIEDEADKSAVEKAIIADLQQDVRKNGIEYKVDFLDKIPPDPNGKIRLLISHVK